MIRKLLNRLFRSKKTQALHYPEHGQKISAKKAGIRRHHLSPAALHVIRQLQQAGYTAYIVGGAVRDLLLGLQPKDFDIATNATPEEVRQQFKRAHIIGKRFRIVHVSSHGETIEVTTFRGDSQAPTDASGRILHDNVFGSLQEDAKRRDFTFNALYYDPYQEIILDYHHGVADLQAKKLVMIGQPMLRYREDPVRLVRAIRLAAKLHVNIDQETFEAIHHCAPLLNNIPKARLFDETLKIFYSGQSLRCVMMMNEVGLQHYFFPLLDTLLAAADSRTFIENALHNTDTRIQEDKSISTGFLFAVLLWYEVIAYWKNHEANGEHSTPALFQAMEDVLAIQEEQLAIPRRFSGQMKEIWMLQPRFEQRTQSRAFRLLAHPRFRAGYDFLLLRASADSALTPLAEWWTDFQHADSQERETLLSALQIRSPRKKRRKKVVKPLSVDAPLE